MNILERRILFVGGKGGVGKTTVAASLALLAAEQNRRVLVVSTDPAHSLGDIFNQTLQDNETMLATNLWGLEIDPDATTDRYIEGVKHNLRDLANPAMYSEIERQMDLARAAPGAVEAALLERVATLLDEAQARYNLVIFDTAPTGHTLRLLSLPEIMAAWTDGLLKQHERSSKLGEVLERLGGRRGSKKGNDLDYLNQTGANRPQDDRKSRIRQILLERRRKFHRARRLILNSEQTAFMLVLNAEKLPILESKKALAILREFKVPVAALIVNRVLPKDAEGHFIENRRRQEATYLHEIEQEFTTLPRIYLPLLPCDVHGINTLKWIGQQLSQYSMP
ncbi:MAG: arsenic-transporting ATPase [Candidatus Contendobacter odensis]|uniref:arsenite-transporting ATPase n=1 Tax=Candidatus Contendibacter odensensis TaxID=1400860 RepID=A0A2G6PGI5_9GAMM|nr:MAG: arsenic-transporting ATPase [Candidatus Contendobacter odensis]